MKILRRLKCNRIAWQVSDSFDFKYLNFSLSASIFCLFKFVTDVYFSVVTCRSDLAAQVFMKLKMYMVELGNCKHCSDGMNYFHNFYYHFTV